MASKLFTFFTFSYFVILALFTSPSYEDTLYNSNPTRLVSPETICESTPHPHYCKTLLPNQTANVYDHCRYSVRKSLSQSHKFLRMIDNHLKRKSTLTKSAIQALKDCRQLAKLNKDFLLSTLQTVSTGKTLSRRKTEHIHTLLSAILTNEQTCLDGLEDAASARRINKGHTHPVLNYNTKLYSVSLALFTKSWVPKKRRNTIWKPTKKQLGFRNGHLPLKMSSKTRAIYESLSRRKLIKLQGVDDVVVSNIVTVSQDGSGNFTNINDAISAAPDNSAPTDGYFLIYVTAGVYEEHVSINEKKMYVMMIGDGIDQTIITGSRSYVDSSTTFNSATFAVVADGFVAVNITFRNTAGAIKHQAVAVRNGADMSTFYRCSFEGYQDTLYTYSQRQFYRECDIYGTVDFIFGNAAAIFQNCNIYPRLPMSGQYNVITAQGRTQPNQKSGISIQNCAIRAADDLASSNSNVQTYLGRPWKTYSRTIYMETFMDSLINPAGWIAWSGDFALSTLYYAEYHNTGPGSITTNRVTWPTYHVIDNAGDAAKFTAANFLLADDWLPQTGVPYNGGLIREGS